jgi:hypothetical protein
MLQWRNGNKIWYINNLQVMPTKLTCFQNPQNPKAFSQLARSPIKFRWRHSIVKQRCVRTFAYWFEILMWITISSYLCCSRIPSCVRINTMSWWVVHKMLEGWSWHSLLFRLQCKQGFTKVKKEMKIPKVQKLNTNRTVDTSCIVVCYFKQVWRQAFSKTN